MSLSSLFHRLSSEFRPFTSNSNTSYPKSCRGMWNGGCGQTLTDPLCCSFLVTIFLCSNTQSISFSDQRTSFFLFPFLFPRGFSSLCSLVFFPILNTFPWGATTSALPSQRPPQLPLPVLGRLHPGHTVKVEQL